MKKIDNGTHTMRYNKVIKGKINTKKCSICHGSYIGFGNNADPVTKGRCCNRCDRIVTEVRIMRLINEKWYNK